MLSTVVLFSEIENDLNLHEMDIPKWVNNNAN
jgi:hypothetical protein